MASAFRRGTRDIMLDHQGKTQPETLQNQSKDEVTLFKIEQAL